jgi:hypothetical protein
MKMVLMRWYCWKTKSRAYAHVITGVSKATWETSWAAQLVKLVKMVKMVKMFNREACTEIE